VSPPGDKATAARRPHDAEASRRALLDAGREVFDEVGYDRATTREIGDRAGVDPALIARYFGSKEGLFIAAIAAGAPGDEEIDFGPAELLRFLLERWDERGHNPISRALASPSLTDGARERISAVVGDRVLTGLAAELRDGGTADAELRAELLVALAVGVAMTRANGTLETLAAAPREEVLAALAPLVRALQD
jgi:AcrR family transcriptional regulator